MIRIDFDHQIATIFLSRPEKRNAMTPEMFGAINDALAAVRQREPRALVLGGDGPVFCGGFDLRLCLDRPGTLETLLRELASVVRALRTLPQPVVIAAQGAAIAGGCALLSAADVVVSDRGARFGYPVVPLGVSPAVSAATLRQATGDGRARERLLDPALISGAEALRVGLVHEVVERPEDVPPRALDVARQLASKPVPAMVATKAWVNEIADRMAVAEAASKSLAASLSLVGSSEERERLTRLFAKA